MKSIVDTEAIYRTTISKFNRQISQCTSDNLIKHYEFMKEHEQLITGFETLEQDIAGAACELIIEYRSDNKETNYYNNLFSDFKNDIVAMADLTETLSHMEIDNEYYGIVLKTLKKVVNIVMTDESKTPLQLALLQCISWELPISFSCIN